MRLGMPHKIFANANLTEDVAYFPIKQFVFLYLRFEIHTAQELIS